MTRRQFVFTVSAAVAAGPGLRPAQGSITLPRDVCFVGEKKFEAVAARAVRENWAARPIGARMVLLAHQLEGTPYCGFTLEIDDHTECPSCNFDGLDCWTFFEIVLGLARMLETPRPRYAWEDLLREVEWTRYRGGKCTGGYLERLHYLDEWFLDNFARQNIWDLTRRLPGAQRLYGRKSTEMTALWRSYRYLKNNPELRPPMKEIEARVNQLPVFYVPKSKVPDLEPQIQSGDIIGIVTNQQGGVCSHVGLAVRTDDGVLHFMHASKNHHVVILDKRLSGYLNDFTYHAGIMVARPLPTRYAIRDEKVYQSRLALLKAGKPPAGPTASQPATAHSAAH